MDPRPQHRDFYQGCDYLTPNWKESRALLNLPEREPTPGRRATVAATLASVLDDQHRADAWAARHSVLQPNGDEQFAVPTIAREVFDVSGAGDTVVAAFALALAAGADHADRGRHREPGGQRRGRKVRHRDRHAGGESARHADVAAAGAARRRSRSSRRRCAQKASGSSA